MARLLTRPDGRHLLIRMLFRPFSSQGDSLERNVLIFDRVLKGKQRERAAWLRNAQDPLLSSVAENLLDRLDDCRRKFPTALNLGGALDFTKQLLKNRGGIEMLLMMDMSENMLRRSLEMDPCKENRCTCSYMPIIADEEFLPLKPQSLDLVLSCLGLHWVNDLAGMMIQCRMAMKPDGLFLASMFGGETLRELRIACTLAQLEREGGISPRVSPFAQVRDAGNLLIRAGLALPAVDVEEYTMRYPSALALIEHLRSMGETNALLKRTEILKKETAIAAAAIYESMFGEPDGTVPATFEVIYMAGWSPDPSQPRPKKRGSGTVSFDELHKVFGENSS